VSHDTATGSMPLVEHLRELRVRVLYSAAAVFVGMGLSLAFTHPVIEGLTAMCDVCRFIVVRPTESFVMYFRVALILGLALATPVVLYQMVAFVIPALHRQEKRYLYLMLPGAGALFALGLLFAYRVVVPRSINFLATFLLGVAEPAWSIGEYISFVTNLMFIIGVTFQTPLVVFLLAKIGVLSPAAMRRYRRHAILIVAVLAAVLTPTPDPFTMILVMAPMLLLYELGILLARFA
jgi:sec-independent protein translocase protein TatC